MCPPLAINMEGIVLTFYIASFDFFPVVLLSVQSALTL